MPQSLLTQTELDTLDQCRFATHAQDCWSIEGFVICYIEGPAALSELNGLEAPAGLRPHATLDELLIARQAALKR